MELSGRPLYDNPLDAALFVPREESHRLEQNCRDGVNTLLLGGRGAGKTTLLRHVLFRLRESGFPAVGVDASPVEDPLGLMQLTVAALGGSLFRDRPMDPRTAGLGEVGAILEELRSIPTSSEADAPRTAILVDLPAGARSAHSLFGRFRDELWQLPYTWVVAAPTEMRVDLLTPPADAFFEDVVELAPLTTRQQEDLIRRRLEPGEATPWRLLQDGEENPRRLLAVVRESVRSGQSPDSRLRAIAELEGEVASLGRAASMLYSELRDYGPASASDGDLLDRLGWSRQRAAQVLTELERAGFLEAEVRPGPQGRPRKVFTIVPPERR